MEPEFREGVEEVERLRAGDRVVQGALVRTYLPRLLRTARGAGLGLEEAEDVVQETFVTFLDKSASFEGRSLVRTYLYGILYHKIRETRRNRRHEEDLDEIDQSFASRFDASGSWSRPPLPADDRVFAEQVREYLTGCMERLTEQQRAVFQLKDVEEVASDEVCNILEVSRTNMGVLLHRARNRLRECLEEHGVRRGAS